MKSANDTAMKPTESPSGETPPPVKREDGDIAANTAGEIAVRETSNAGTSSPLATGLESWSLRIAVIVILAMLSSWLVPRSILLFDTISQFQVQFTLIVLFSALIQIWRKRVFTGVVLLLLVAFPLMNLIAFYVPASQPESATRTIRIMTYNVLYYSDDYRDVVDMIEEVDADIVGLIEFNGRWHSGFGNQLKQYPYRVGPLYGKVIYSKVPIEILSSDLLPNSPSVVGCMEARFQVDGQPVHFVLVHSTSPKTHARRLERDGQILGLRDIIHGWRGRAHLIVAGDFNSTTHGYALNRMMRDSGLRDTRRGFGVQNSWPTWFWPLSICIDHCFVSDGVKVIDRRQGPGAGSDHLPVVVEMAFGELELPASIDGK